MIANLLGALAVRRVPWLCATPGPGPRLLPRLLERSNGHSGGPSYSDSGNSYRRRYSSGPGSYGGSGSSRISGGGGGQCYDSGSREGDVSGSSCSSRVGGDLASSNSCTSSRVGGDLASSNSCTSSRGSGGESRLNGERSCGTGGGRGSAASAHGGGGGSDIGSAFARRGAAESPPASQRGSPLGRRRSLSTGMAANQSKIDWNSWEKAKDQLSRLKDVEERRKYYKCSGNFIQLKSVGKWSEMEPQNQEKLTEVEKPGGSEYEVNSQLNDKVSLFMGDITLLEIDAIVNAANSTLLGGGGVDGCIHRSAGSLLKDECRSLAGCNTGKAKITCGYRLPSKYVIHTVGPRVLDTVPTPEERKQLESCYSECLHIVEDKELRSVAFPCISTGIYGFPNEPAAKIALETTRNWLEKNHSKVDRIIFCLFLSVDEKLYNTLMAVYFPRAPKETSESVTDGAAVSGPGNESDDKDTEAEDGLPDDENDKEMASQEPDSVPTTKTTD